MAASLQRIMGWAYNENWLYTACGQYYFLSGSRNRSPDPEIRIQGQSRFFGIYVDTRWTNDIASEALTEWCFAENCPRYSRDKFRTPAFRLLHSFLTCCSFSWLKQKVDWLNINSRGGYSINTRGEAKITAYPLPEMDSDSFYSCFSQLPGKHSPNYWTRIGLINYSYLVNNGNAEGMIKYGMSRKQFRISLKSNVWIFLRI